MADSMRVRTLLRPGAVALVAAGAVGLSSGVSVATPAVSAAPAARVAPVGLVTPPMTSPASPSPSVAEVRREVTDLGRRLDAVTEQYNKASVRLDRARKDQIAAEDASRRIEARLHQDAGRARAVAEAVYRAGPLSRMVSVVSSGSPREFLDRLSALDGLSTRRHRIIDALVVDRDRAAEAAAEADRVTAEARRIAEDLAAKKDWITQRLPLQRALLDRVTAEQRRQAADPPDRASRGTARVPVVDAAQTSAAAKAAVAAAMSKLGSPYVWAAAGPDSFDCSGLMMWAWAQAGVSLPHYSGDQYNSGTHVSRSELRPGDLVFFYQGLSHVGMYVGNGKIIHAPQPGDVVKISSLDSFPYAGATRVG